MQPSATANAGIAERDALLEVPCECVAGQDWDAAKATINAALKLDQHNAATYDALANRCHVKGEAE